ncbi:MAG: glycosyltransferase involved in cell wall biosynthesis [Verrucomicrobiales bacterium]|jgi:glycosyltransferase involved in cell wall biosynthesis
MTRYLRERTLFPPLLSEEPSSALNLVVVIPAKDEPELVSSLESLRACEKPECAVEIIVVVNNGETDTSECVQINAEIAAGAKKWAELNSTPDRRFFVLHQQQLPKKHAGVGLARKIGMDEACRRLEAVENHEGVIVCFDADSRCDPNYLIEIDQLFRRNPECQASSIYIEHPTSGTEFSQDVYDGIVFYELHLRYYVGMLKKIGFPFAIQTIGSAIAVRNNAYQAQNGMNRKKAGEDFYFLHKFTPLNAVEELNSTRVIPSPRISDRVPFGTGKAVGDWIESGKDSYTTYAWKSFIDLQRLIEGFRGLYLLESGSQDSWFAELPESLRSFLQPDDFWTRIVEIRSNSTSQAQFELRFFRWFNAFQVMKYLNHAREHFYPNDDVVTATQRLLGSESGSARDLLKAMRQRDRFGLDQN